MNSTINYTEVINWLQAKGAEQYGNHFKIVEADYPILYKLIAYFLRDEQACHQFNIDLQKGILLTGPIGCGKTSLMNLMKNLTAENHKYSLKPCRDIGFEFIQEGFQIIHKYSIGKLYHYEPRNYCFDDLGTENNLKYFGNESNVMAEIILSRYDSYCHPDRSRRVMTHFTTNLSATEIETNYGNRVRSRLRQMVNLIAYDKSTPDKR